MMQADMSTVLVITGIGMGLVFVAILLLWGLIELLTRIATHLEKAASSGEVDSPDESLLRKQAAVAAVGVALAKQRGAEAMRAFPLPPTALVSAWQAVLRSNMLNKRRNSG